jgi:hypothetical protein
MPIGVAQVVCLGFPVVSQFEHGTFGFILVADEGQRELAIRIVLAAQQAHAENIGVEIERAVEIADAQHGVEDSHGSGSSCPWVVSLCVAQCSRSKLAAVGGAALAITGRVAAAARRAARTHRASPGTGARPRPRSARSDSSRPDARLRARPRNRSAPARGGSAASAGESRSGGCSCPSACAALDSRSGGMRQAEAMAVLLDAPAVPVQRPRPQCAHQGTRAHRSQVGSTSSSPPSVCGFQRAARPARQAQHQRPAEQGQAWRHRRRRSNASRRRARRARAGGRAASARGCARSAPPRPAAHAGAPPRARHDDRPGARTSAAPIAAAPARPACPR